MYKNLVPLTFRDHGQMLLQSPKEYHYAASEVVCPIVLNEFGLIIREYPIIFLKKGSLPCALLGIRQKKNIYVDDNGKWLANYTPLFIQKYPFMLDEGEPISGSHEKTHRIAVDNSSSMLSTSEGKPLFNPDGSHGSALEEKLEVLKAFEHSQKATIHFVNSLRDNELLVDKQFILKSLAGEQTGITGIQMIDEAKLNELSSEAFNELRQNNFLPFIYAHLFSIHNLRQGVIGGRYPIPTKPQEEPDPGFKLSDDGDLDIDWDNFKF